MGMRPTVIPTFWNAEKANRAKAPEHSILPERIPCDLGGTQQPEDDHPEQGHDEQPSDKAELLAHSREDEVGLLSWDESAVGRGTMEDPGTEDPARPDRQYRLGQVVVGSARAGALVQKRVKRCS